MEVVCEPVLTEPAADLDPAPVAEPEARSRGRPKGAPNKVKTTAKEPKVKEPKVKEPRVREPAVSEPVFSPVLEHVEPVRERPRKERAPPRHALPRAASPPPFEPTFEELLGHMGRAMAQQRAVRAQSRSDLYSQFLA
jgi:hypothetical protein